MAQFSNSRSEFMTSDLGLNDIEYERKGGFFMTNKKTALAVSAVVLIVIAAGFVGAYIGSIPKEKVDRSSTPMAHSHYRHYNDPDACFTVNA